MWIYYKSKRGACSSWKSASIKKIKTNRYVYYEEFASMYSDAKGYYEFKLENWYYKGEYKVVILKDDIG